MLVINSIEKSRLQADSFSYSGNGVAWKARFVLFLGFALLAGGLAGSVVCFPDDISFRPLTSEALFVENGILIGLLDGYGPEVPPQRLRVVDFILWDCERYFQWADYA